MKLIPLDASSWNGPDDFYEALLPELGAPDWHGRNLNALDDSLYGGINRVEPPFRVVVAGTATLGPEMRMFLAQVVEVFADARKRYGEDVAFELV
jgi:RNAse (barnase) inhibitor barstar